MRSRLKQVSVKFSAPAFGAAMLMFTSGCALPWSVPRYRHSCSLTEQETRETALHLQAELFREYEISTYFDECNDGRDLGGFGCMQRVLIPPRRRRRSALMAVWIRKIRWYAGLAKLE